VDPVELSSLEAKGVTAEPPDEAPDLGSVGVLGKDAEDLA